MWSKESARKEDTGIEGEEITVVGANLPVIDVEKRGKSRIIIQRRKVTQIGMVITEIKVVKVGRRLSVMCVGSWV
jgi:hypothetical protein